MEGYTTLILLICLGCVCAYDFNKLSGEERRLALRNEIYKLVDDHENRRGKAPAPQELERGTDQHGEDKELALRELLYRLLSDPETRRGEEYNPMELNRDVNGWGCKKPCPPEKPHCAHYLGVCTTYK
ncbi:uncharacterized protein LOC110988191 isoform X1 [Acanthaster planci]|uniref:Uncharacterized protein LOC110988191 isoform X1 n=1 Tax=Acanthaster planci TaxID=133434 RepID=A0A8B7ZP41_ACAPL|nr:uncharacterized protein LOC110988191 isoform X1 [Acanthaster planci]